MPNNADIFIDYPFEDVAFRCDGATGKRYVKFYGKQEQDLNPNSDLFWNAARDNNRITKAEYDAK
jgi:hypothetical protein